MFLCQYINNAPNLVFPLVTISRSRTEHMNQSLLNTSTSAASHLITVCSEIRSNKQSHHTSARQSLVQRWANGPLSLYAFVIISLSRWWAAEASSVNTPLWANLMLTHVFLHSEEHDVKSYLSGTWNASDSCLDFLKLQLHWCFRSFVSGDACQIES